VGTGQQVLHALTLATPPLAVLSTSLKEKRFAYKVMYGYGPYLPLCRTTCICNMHLFWQPLPGLGEEGGAVATLLNTARHAG
jgi:hypothetical protein